MHIDGNYQALTVKENIVVQSARQSDKCAKTGNLPSPRMSTPLSICLQDQHTSQLRIDILRPDIMGCKISRSHIISRKRALNVYAVNLWSGIERTLVNGTRIMRTRI